MYLCHRNGFLPITSEVDTAEASVLRVALVGLGGHVRGSRDLDTWYTLPESPESCLVLERGEELAGNKVMRQHSNT